MKSLQWLQNVGCLKNLGTNWCPFTTNTSFCRNAPRRCTVDLRADDSKVTSSLALMLLQLEVWLICKHIHVTYTTYCSMGCSL